MKSVVWIFTVVAALLWTVLAAVVASLTGWLAANAGDVVNWGGQVAQWPVPEWLALWVSPELLGWVRMAVAGGLDWVAAALPALGWLLQWMVPALWVFWALGMVCLLALAGGASYAIGRISRPSPGQRLG